MPKPCDCQSKNYSHPCSLQRMKRIGILTFFKKYILIETKDSQTVEEESSEFEDEIALLI